MAKISELSDGGSLLPTDTLIAVRSGSNVKVVNDTLNVTTLNPDQINMGDNEQIRMGNSQDLLIYHDGTNSRINDNGTGNLRLQTGGNTKLEVTSTGIDVTGNATFDDNGKAIFGAGSDLQIYHDSSDSYIDEVGTGNLLINANNLRLRDTSGNPYLLGNSGAEVRLYHSGNTKLQTTSTGIDVTGTVTADGLTVDKEGTDHLKITDTSSSNALTVGIGNTVGTVAVDPTNSVASSKLDFSIDGSTAIRINAGGDISFYEDTGTTPKFFWDASAESLGIGTDSLSGKLHVKTSASSALINASADDLIVEHSGSGGITVASGASAYGSMFFADSGSSVAGYIQYLHGADYMRFGTNGSEAMRIDSSGNVGIGTSSITAGRTLETVGGRVRFDNTADAYHIDLAVNGNTYAYIGSDTDNHLVFYNGIGTERLRIDSSGNVKIGTGTDRFSYLTASSANLQIDGGVVFEPGSGNNVELFNYRSTDMLFGNGGTEAMRIDSSGRVGIGTSSPAEELHISSSVPKIQIQDSDGTNQYGQLYHSAGSTVIQARNNTSDGTIIFQKYDGTTTDETMRLDSSGNLLVGKTSAGIGTAGFEASPNGYFYGTRNGNSMALNRLTTDGDIAVFQKDGTAVGSVGTASNTIYIDGSSANTGLQFAGSAIVPRDAGNLDDGGVDLGTSSYRFKDLYATNGTIQTSDRNEKQDIEELSDAEQRVAVACKGLLRKFRWKSAVEEKGDDARIHFGIIAQDLQAAFEAEGLDAGRYAMLISSTWTDEDTGEERTRLGVRYSELLAFIIAAI